MAHCQFYKILRFNQIGKKNALSNRKYNPASIFFIEDLQHLPYEIVNFWNELNKYKKKRLIFEKNAK
jgi:hypothetical protein